MTEKENLLRVIRHQDPVWVPNGMESVITIGSPVLERPAQPRNEELATGRGYIAAPSHGIPYRQELIDAMNDEIKLYGRSFHRKTGRASNKQDAGDA